MADNPTPTLEIHDEALPPAEEDRKTPQPVTAGRRAEKPRENANSSEAADDDHPYFGF